MEVIFNPRCGKCREVGRILDERGARWERIDYLEGMLTRAKLEEILAKLGCGAADVVRWDEKILKEKGISRDGGLSEDALIDLILEHPILPQRPIVIAGSRAIIGRPPEKVLDLL
jgi:arsenate reductase